MAYQRLQVGRALGVIPNDDVNIPNVAAVTTTGTSTTPAGQNSMKDVTVGVDFVAQGVKVGDIVVTSAGSRRVRSVSTNELLLNVEGTTSVPSGTAYTIYSQADNPNNGCTLYVGLAGNLTVQTVGGDVVQFTGVPTGSFIPVHVLKVMSTGTDAQNIVALW
jgi:hypothetical protein